jgi:hypothetical protein
MSQGVDKRLHPRILVNWPVVILTPEGAIRTAVHISEWEKGLGRQLQYRWKVSIQQYRCPVH